ncbi:MAG: hypothetical protein F6K19_22540 [Cyanothece sp. SIO1E1]|nr:hypothetical protein [Cyanothece sp. SIO1E1]
MEMTAETAADGQTNRLLQAQDLLVGSQVIHALEIPAAILEPRVGVEAVNGPAGVVRIRPLNLAAMTLISRAAREDTSLIPLLTIKEAVVEPTLTLDQIRQMHLGLVHYLVSQINRVSGLSAEGEAIADTLSSSLGHTHLLLAKHFGWTPEQVSQLTPGQVAVYLAGIEQFIAWEAQKRQDT